MSDFSPAAIEARIQASIQPQLDHADKLIREYQMTEAERQAIANVAKWVLDNIFQPVTNWISELRGGKPR